MPGDLIAVVPHVLPSGWSSQLIVFGYIGPNVAIPLASFLAAFLGVILLFGRQLLGLVRKAYRAIRARFTGATSVELQAPDTPHDTDE